MVFHERIFNWHWLTHFKTIVICPNNLWLSVSLKVGVLVSSENTLSYLLICLYNVLQGFPSFKIVFIFSIVLRRKMHIDFIIFSLKSRSFLELKKNVCSLSKSQNLLSGNRFGSVYFWMPRLWIGDPSGRLRCIFFRKILSPL